MNIQKTLLMNVYKTKGNNVMIVRQFNKDI